MATQTELDNLYSLRKSLNDPNAQLYGTSTTYAGGFAPQAPSSSLTATANNYQPAAVISSEPARDQIKTAQQQLANVVPPGSIVGDLSKLQVGQTVTLPAGDVHRKTETGFETVYPEPKPEAKPELDTTTTQTYLTSEDRRLYDQEQVIKQQAIDERAELDKRLQEIKNGLSPAGQGIVDSIRKTFDSQIAKMGKINDLNLGIMTQAGIRSGRSRYSIEAEQSTLTNEMREGVQRISDLEAQREGLIAQAIQADKDQQYELLYKNMSAVNDIEKRKLDQLQSLRNDFIAREKVLNDRIKAGQEVKTLGLKYKTDVAEGLADYIDRFMPRNDDVLAAQFIDAIATNWFGDEEGYVDPGDKLFLLSAAEKVSASKEKKSDTSDILNYNFAKREGYQGDFGQWQTDEANRKAKAAGTGAGGLTPSQINSTVNQIAGNFDNEQIVKSYNVASEAFQTIKSIGTNTKSPADDIAFIYAFAKIMDPNSVVREGEYNTIQRYAQTWADNFGFSAKRIFSNTNFLTADAKQKMLNALQPRITTLNKQYENLRKEYQRQVDDAYAGKARTITQYSPPESSENVPQPSEGPIVIYNGKRYKVAPDGEMTLVE